MPADKHPFQAGQKIQSVRFRHFLRRRGNFRRRQTAGLGTDLVGPFLAGRSQLRQPFFTQRELAAEGGYFGLCSRKFIQQPTRRLLGVPCLQARYDLQLLVDGLAKLTLTLGPLALGFGMPILFFPK